MLPQGPLICGTVTCDKCLPRSEQMSSLVAAYPGLLGATQRLENTSLSLQIAFSHEEKWFFPHLGNDQLRWQQQRLVVSWLVVWRAYRSTAQEMVCQPQNLPQSDPTLAQAEKALSIFSMVPFFLHADYPFRVFLWMKSVPPKHTVIYRSLDVPELVSWPAALSALDHFRNVNTWVPF